jgi:hypothetical protein
MLTVLYTACVMGLLYFMAWANIISGPNRMFIVGVYLAVAIVIGCIVSEIESG